VGQKLWYLLVVRCLFKELECLVKLETEEEQVFVYPVVVYFVPMHIKYVDERFKPLLLSVLATLLKSIEYFGDFLSCVSLVDRLI
jgi:hypothetical protein